MSIIKPFYIILISFIISGNLYSQTEAETVGSKYGTVVLEKEMVRSDEYIASFNILYAGSKEKPIDLLLPVELVVRNNRTGQIQWILNMKEHMAKYNTYPVGLIPIIGINSRYLCFSDIGMPTQIFDIKTGELILDVPNTGSHHPIYMNDRFIVLKGSVNLFVINSKNFKKELIIESKKFLRPGVKYNETTAELVVNGRLNEIRLDLDKFTELSHDEKIEHFKKINESQIITNTVRGEIDAKLIRADIYKFFEIEGSFLKADLEIPEGWYLVDSTNYINSSYGEKSVFIRSNQIIQTRGFELADHDQTIENKIIRLKPYSRLRYEKQDYPHVKSVKADVITGIIKEVKFMDKIDDANYVCSFSTGAYIPWGSMIKVQNKQILIPEPKNGFIYEEEDNSYIIYPAIEKNDWIKNIFRIPK